MAKRLFRHTITDQLIVADDRLEASRLCQAELFTHVDEITGAEPMLFMDEDREDVELTAAEYIESWGDRPSAVVPIQ